MKIQVLDIEGKKVDTLDIAKEWEGMPSSKQAVKDAVVYYLANKRMGTAKAKDRSEVNFTTRKPWAQKGTGRARSGTASSPIWRKGGVVFGPKPRDFSIGLPKKVLRLALKSALAGKLKDKKIIIIDKIDIKKPKTKDVTGMIKNLEGGRKPLIVLKENNKNVRLSARNIPGVGIDRASDLNTYNVLVHGKLIIEKDAWGVIESKLLE